MQFIYIQLYCSNKLFLLTYIVLPSDINNMQMIIGLHINNYDNENP